ncbi:unnamed protein product [Phyllotreta striolata]|uniref:AB hydrolase-1 domain-containing protein n=1 Tax=Phyllotreta striolata TaxID=444603 RepID=A0A9N9U1E2_PHYSR|nr:unnamed protein product [Phyllotreta striolata]
MKNNTQKSIEEFNIPVPWGHIAVKCWGSSDNPHVIMVHGTCDNAGTFDNLLELLTDGFYYICMDLPSHGKSSRFPPFLPIQFMDFVLPIKLVLDYFKREKYIFIGHSLGGQLGYLIAQLYPRYIEKIISLDATPMFHSVNSSNAIKYLKRKLDNNFDLLMDNKPSTVDSYAEILEQYRTNRYRGEILTEAAAKPMLDRCLQTTVDGKYYITTDPRMKWFIEPLSDDLYKLGVIKNDPVNCPILIIYAKYNFLTRLKYSKVVNAFHSFKNVKIVYALGKHDVHNNKPEFIVQHIHHFLINTKSKM